MNVLSEHTKKKLMDVISRYEMVLFVKVTNYALIRLKTQIFDFSFVKSWMLLNVESDQMFDLMVDKTPGRNIKDCPTA